MMYYIFFIATFISSLVGLWLVFTKAGEQGWKAIVPLYNYWVSLKIIGKPKWWIIWAIVPIVNLVIPLIILVEFCKSFGKEGLGAQTLAMLFPWAYLPYLGLNKKAKYLGPVNTLKRAKKSMYREWADAIVFALIAATFIRTFFIEAYKIPTPSMEDSLLVGDHLFVSKFHYGARFPMTPIAFPLAHHTMPVLNTKAYLDFVQLPYFRLPSMEQIHRNDIVVFNFPEGDTVAINLQEKSYYDLQRQGLRFPQSALTIRPLDKKENYVKRCVAIPGDRLEIRNGDLYINNELAHKPKHLQYAHQILTKQPLEAAFLNLFKIYFDDDKCNLYSVEGQQGFNYCFHITLEVAEKLRQHPAVKEVKILTAVKNYVINSDDRRHSRVFPNTKSIAFTRDNYGPIELPKKGQTVALSRDNIAIYERLIRIYGTNPQYRESCEL